MNVYALYVLAAIVLVIGAFASWIGIALSRSNETHTPFKWTTQRVKILIVCMLWPITFPVIIAQSFFEGFSPKSNGR
jgi:drug/metabolite transporter superfamily protein YnfA